MADVNPEQERTRLRRVYSGMSEEELREIAEDGASLTPEAVQALTAEIARRGLDVFVSTSSPGEDTLQQRDLVTIRRFQTLSEAMVAKSVLDGAGIESFLFDDNTARMYVSIAVGGIRMQVNRDDAEQALELLQQPTPDGSDVEGDSGA
jgi:hypothetical protein